MRNIRSGSYFKQALGTSFAIIGSFIIREDVLKVFAESSGGITIAALGGGLSLVGFLITWSAGEKINYDNDIANYKKRKRKNK